jgi:glycosyltransferase involved in cell wall biosynthesis
VHIALISATPANISQGSGTFVAAANLQAGLEALGHKVTVLQVAGPGGTSLLSRLRFNATLQPRQVQGCDLMCGFDLDGWLLASRVSIPYVAYLHGVIADEARFERGWSRWSLLLQSRAERSAAHRAHRVLAPSGYSAQRIADCYGVNPAKISVVQPGFDLDRWTRALAVVPDARDPGHLTVLSVGHLYPRKNHAALLRATALLGPRVPGLRVRIAGDGQERGRLARLARELKVLDRVEFLGQVSFDTLVGEYAACDVFCLPTLQEGFGIVFAEAMASGKPVVACAAGATSELILDGENGLLAPPGDDAALADALGRLAEDASLRARMGDLNRVEAGRRFGLAPATRRFLDAVGMLAEGRALARTTG